MALWIVIYIAFRTPPVQKWVAGKISDILSKQLHTKASLQGLDIDLFDEVVLDGVYIEDQQGDTLLYVEKFRVNIQPWALLNKNVYINLVEVRGLYANLYQPEGQKDLNFAFIPEAFASTDTTNVEKDTTASSWVIDLRRVQLNRIRFDYDADGTEMNLTLNSLAMLFNKLGLEESHIQGDKLNVDGLQFAMLLPPTDTTAAADTTNVADTTAMAATQTQDVLNPSGFAYSLNEFVLDNSQVTYRVKQPDTTAAGQLDFEDMVLADLQTHIEDIEVGKNNIALYLENLAFREARSGFAVNKMVAKATIDMPAVNADLMDLETPNSQLNGNMQVSMKLAETTKELIGSLKFNSELNSAKLGMADAAYFTNALDSMPEVKALTPRLSWNTHIANGEGSVKNLLLNVDDQVRMDASMSFSNLSAVMDSTGKDSPYIDLHLKELRADLDFIRQFTTDSIGRYLPKANRGPLVLTADAKGTLNDIKANAKLDSRMGSVEALAAYALNKNKAASISAQLTGSQLDIREVMKLLGNPDSVANAYDQLTFHADATATALMSATDTTLRQANAKFIIDRFDYNKHHYRNLVVDAGMEHDSLQAKISYQDSLLELHANAQVLLKADTAYTMNLQVKNANLFRLNLVPDSIIVSNLLMQADAKGTTPDDIMGYLRLTSTEIIKGKNTFYLDSLLLNADRQGKDRTFTLSSDEINGKISGQFDFENLPAAITDFQEYYLAHYDLPVMDTTHSKSNIPEQQLAFTFSVDSTPSFASVFVPELNIPSPITIEGKFNSSNRSMNLNLKVPRLAYGNNVVDSFYMNAKTDNKQIDMNMAINAIQSGDFTIPNLRFSGELSGVSKGKDKLVTTDLDFNVGIGEVNAPYRLDLNAVLSSSQDTIKLMLNNSELVVQDKPWRFSENAYLAYAKNYLDINDFSLTQGKQGIFINTDNANDSTDMEMAIQQLALAPLMDALDLDSYGIKGMLKGKATLASMFESGPISANLAINGLEVQDQKIGELELKANKGNQANKKQDLLSMLMTLKGPTQDVKIEGDYNLASDSNNIDLQLDLNSLQLEPWQVFAKDYIKTMKGELQANMHITGSPADPAINGNFAVADEVMIQTTIAGATHYLPKQKLTFGGKNVQFDKFTVLDSARTPATLSGTIGFADFADPEVDLSFATKNFILVNSKEYENPNFYGKAVASADFDITGPVSKIKIEGDAGIEEGTDMVVALVSGDAEAAQAGYIEFVDVNDFLAADTLSTDSLEIPSKQKKDSVTVSGFALSTTVHVSPEAVFTIVIDPSNGDKVVASGEADLKVDQSINGDLTMQGTYVLNSGSYNLSFAGLVQKEFTVKDGSTITWSGDPANADLDMTAIYSTETDLGGLLSDAYRGIIGQDILSQNLKTNVLLNITGTIQAPELAFDIEIPDLSSLQGQNAVLAQDVVKDVLRDKTLLYKQVFGLIVLNRFIPASGGFGGGGSGEGGGIAGSVNDKINSSVSRLLSSQLSSLSQDYLGGVEINVGLQQSDANSPQQNATSDKDLNVELSKSLFNDRLTISAGGVTTLSTGQGGAAATTGGSSSSSQVMAQFEVLYRLDESGNLNIRVFQSPRRNPLTNAFENNAGVSVMYQKAFDQLLKSDDVLQSNPPGQEKETGDETDTQPQDIILNNTQNKAGGN